VSSTCSAVELDYYILTTTGNSGPAYLHGTSTESAAGEASVFVSSATSQSDVGNYTYSFVADTRNYYRTSIDFELEIKEAYVGNHAPYFMSAMRNITVSVGESRQYVLPRYFD